MKGKVYRTVVRPAMVYCLEMVALTKRQEAESKVLELKMLRLSFSPGRGLEVRIRGRAQVEQFEWKFRESGLRWSGHAQKRYSRYFAQQ